MKKTLLLGSFAILGLVANAQLVAESSTEGLEALGLNKDAVSVLPEGSVIAEGDAGVLATAYEESWKIFTPAGSYKNVKVNELELTLSSGITGNTNPTFVDYANGVPSAGAVYTITPAKSGWVTVFTKLNPNKQYVVFEGKSGPLSYTLGYANPQVDAETGEITAENVINYTLPYDPETFEIDFTAEDASKYFVLPTDKETGEPIPSDDPAAVKPQFPYLVAGYEASPGEGTGFLNFNVLEGKTYYVAALGSKIALGGFVLTEGAMEPTITFVNTDTLPPLTFEGTIDADAGVESLVAAPYNENAPIYNVMGQKVGADAKGILIQNGKKFIRR